MSDVVYGVVGFTLIGIAIALGTHAIYKAIYRKAWKEGYEVGWENEAWKL